MVRVPKKLRKRNTILTKPAPPLANDKIRSTALENWSAKAWCPSRRWTMQPPSMTPTSSACIRWKKRRSSPSLARAPKKLRARKGALTQAEGQAAYAKSLLDATVIRAPVKGTILDRTAEKGELHHGQFASAARAPVILRWPI